MRRKPDQNYLTQWVRRLMVVFGVVGMLAVGIGVYLNYYIQSQGGLARFISYQLSQNDQDIVIIAEQADFQIDGTAQQLELSIMDVSISQQDQHIDMPQAKFTFGWSSLLSLAPKEIELQTGEIVLFKDEDSLRAGQSSDWLASTITSYYRNISDNRNSMLALWLSNVRRITVSGADITLFEDQQKTRLLTYFSDVDIVVTPSKDGKPDQIHFRVSGTQRDSGGAEQGRASLSVTHNLLSSLSEFSLTLWEFDVTTASPLVTIPDSLSITPTTQLSGKVDGIIDSGAIFSLDINAFVTGGFSTGLGMQDIAAEKIELTAQYSAKDRLVLVNNATVTLPENQQITLSGQFFAIGLPTISFKGSVLAQDISLALMRAQFEPHISMPEPTRQLLSYLQGGRFQTITMEFAGNYQTQSKMLSLSRVSMTSDFENVRLGYRGRQYQQLLGTLAGKIELDMTTPDQFDKVLISTALSDGVVRLDGLDAPVRIDSADMVVRVLPDRISVQKFRLVTENEDELFAQAERRQLDGEFVTDISVQSDRLDATLLQSLWPEALAQKTRRFVTERFTGGTLADINLDFRLAEQDRVVVTDMTGSFAYNAGDYTWLSGLSDIRIENSIVSFADNKMQISASAGKFGSVSLKNSEIMFFPVLHAKGQPRNLTFKIRGEGGSEQLLEILAHERINRLEAFGLAGRNAKAVTGFKFSADGYLEPGKPLALSNIEIDGELAEAQIDKLPMSKKLRDGDIELRYRNNELQLSGTANISGMPATFSYTQNADKDVDIKAKFLPSTVFTAQIRRFLPATIQGALGATIELGGNIGTGNYDVDAELDLAPVSLYSELLEWGKLKDEKGQISGRLTFKDKALSEINIDKLQAGSLYATGRIALTRTGEIDIARLENIQLPGTQLAEILVERKNDGLFFLTTEGAQLDISPFLTLSGSGSHPDFGFDITADQITVGSSLFLSGNIVGEKRASTEGKALLQGTITTDKSTRFEQTQLDIQFGSDGFVAKGTGLIGGAEASISYEKFKDGRKQLYILSEKGGRVLDGLAITDAIKGGVIELKTVFSADNDDSFVTTILMNDFRLIKGTRAIRVYSVLSPTGLFSLFEGEGTYFSRGDAIIKSEGGVHEISALRAEGASVGLGVVGMYDSNTKQADISGNLVPINLLSEIIGNVPLIGTILTGIDNSGLLVTQFRVNGHIDDLDVEVNPLTLLVPGLFRDLFSPNWLDSEADRIFEGQKP